jgi:thioesterase domain-containing protein
MEPGTPHFTEVEAIAEHCLEEIKKIQPQGPYLLGGYCLGGLVAFEIAQRLLAEGQEIEYLGLIETYLPGSLRRKPKLGTSGLLRSAAGYGLRNRPGRGLVRDAAWAFKKVFLKCCSAVWYRICGLAQGYYDKRNRAVPRFFRNEMVALNLAQSSYRPKPYPGAVYIFKAATTSPWLEIEPSLGWSEFVRGEIRTREVPGDHTSMYEDPQVTEFARLVGESVREVGQAGL